MHRRLLISAFEEGGILVCPVNDYGKWQSKLCRSISEKATDPEKWYTDQVRYKRKVHGGECMWAYDNVRNTSSLMVAMPIIFNKEGLNLEMSKKAYDNLAKGARSLLRSGSRLKVHLPPIAEDIAIKALEDLEFEVYRLL